MVANAVAPPLCRLEQTIDLRTVQKILRALVGVGRFRLTLSFASWSSLPRAPEVLVLSRISIAYFVHIADYVKSGASFFLAQMWFGPYPVRHSVRLLGVRRRQRSPTRNIAAKRAFDVLAKQLGQLLAHAVRHAAFNRLQLRAATNAERVESDWPARHGISAPVALPAR